MSRKEGKREKKAKEKRRQKRKEKKYLKPQKFIPFWQQKREGEKRERERYLRYSAINNNVIIELPNTYKIRDVCCSC